MSSSVTVLRRAAAACVASATLAATATAAAIVPATAAAPDFSSVTGLPVSSNPLDGLGRPTPETQARIHAFVDQPFVPQDLRNAVLSALAFSTGEGSTGEGGTQLVDGGPGFTQFYWPTVSANCIGGQHDAMGSAIAVPGPTDIPAPGAGPGEMVFLFTALGTQTAAPSQGAMKVQWLNIDNFAFGETPLTNHGINPDGPTTVSGRAQTGTGTVVAVLSGAVNTAESHCTFAPTAAIIEAR